MLYFCHEIRSYTYIHYLYLTLAIVLEVLALKNIPLGVAYAVWSGVGIVLTVIVSVLVFKNKIDLPFILGSLLIIAGVVVINLFSKANGH